MKNKSVWLIAAALLLAAAFVLGAGGIISLEKRDESVHPGRLIYKADTPFAEEGVLTLDEAEYTASSFTATVSGTLISRTEDGCSADYTIPAQRVAFSQKNDDEWCCVLQIGDEAVTLYARRSRLASAGGETAYGGINYLTYGSTDYLFCREE